ncbi:MAG TPA: hypothetical protein VIM27_04455 [Gaiellales bacterium]|jgi:uncharacterized membrane protein YeaQ/YmgE (transglycosylase-associated protein family)
MLLFIIVLLISGLAVGGFARLLHPGRDDMSLTTTFLIGIASMLIAGLLVRPLLGFGGGFITAVIVGVGLVALYARTAGNGSGRPIAR